jgi:hypothetical protein
MCQCNRASSGIYSFPWHRVLLHMHCLNHPHAIDTRQSSGCGRSGTWALHPVQMPAVKHLPSLDPVLETSGRLMPSRFIPPSCMPREVRHLTP